MLHLQEAGRATTTVEGFVLDDSSAAMSAILRHDVDRSAERAVALAELEAGTGTRATYYFRCSFDGRFPTSAIERIAALGHETGYHYECLSARDGDRRAALADFERNLERLRQIAPCRTVAMHGAPFSRHNNQDLLVGLDLSSFDLIADASLHFVGRAVAYFTDTGGAWNAGRGRNLRDHVGVGGSYPAPDTAAFAVWLRESRELVYVSTHPERWVDSRGEWVVAAAKDRFIGAAKRVLNGIRSRRPDLA